MIKKKKYNIEFYKKKYKDLENNIHLFSKKIPLYNLFLDNECIKTNSWYNTKVYNTNFNDENNYAFIDSTLKDNDKNEKLLKCDKIILLPSKKQQELLLNMLEGYRIIYNYTLKFIKRRIYNKSHQNNTILNNKLRSKEEKDLYLKEIKNQKKNICDNEKLCIDIIDGVINDIFKKEIRNNKINNLKEENNNDLILDSKILKTYFLKNEIHKVNKKFKTPIHTLNYAVQLACASYKSCLTNLKNGNIKYFNVRYIKKNKPSLIMDIEKCVINKKSFFTSILGKEIKNNQNIEYITNHDCKLHYNRNKNRFTLLIPKEVERIINNKNKYISIDLGLRTLMNCKTNNQYIKIGTNIQKETKKYILKIDKYKKLKNLKNNKKEKILKRLKEKIKNKVEDLHWKTINNLTSNYKTIIIGKWSTKSIISKEDSNLMKMSKRIIQTISYYKLLERLKFKSLINNNNLIIKEEWYTSKACTRCANKKDDLGGNSIYSCLNCNLIIDRDYNGCRNIFLSTIKSIN